MKRKPYSTCSFLAAATLMLLLFTTQKTNAQKVGVNTATPQSSLDVSGNATIGSNYSGNIPAPPDGAIIEGNVGIGTFLPFYKLSVFSNENEVAELASDSPVGAWLRLRNSSTGGTVWNLVSTGQGNSEGAGSLLFRDASQVRMIMNNLGNLGIGTTSPTNRLHVVGGTSLHGRLGLGTNTPGSFDDGLHWPAIEMQANNSDSSDLNLILFEDSNYSPWFNFAHARGTPSAPTSLQDGDDVFNIFANGYDGTSFKQVGGISMGILGTAGTGNLPTAMRFYTSATGEATISERMVILPDGNVGIGLDNPSERLSVRGNLFVKDGTVNVNDQYSLPTMPGTAGQFLMSNGSGEATWETPGGGGGSSGWQLDGNTNGGFRSLGTLDDHDFGIIANGTERIRVASTGLVGIGTTAPTSKLDVDGAMGWKVKTPLAAGVTNPDHTGGIWVYSNGTGEITLPLASECTNRMYVIVNQTGADRSTSGYTDLSGALQTILANASSIWIVSDGSGWLQIK